MIEDIVIGLGIPLVEIALGEFWELLLCLRPLTNKNTLEYIVAGHRFNIFEDIGCFPEVVNVWLAYVLVACWPIAIGLVSAVYCSKCSLIKPCKGSC